MTDPVLMALIVAAQTVILGLGVAWINRKVEKVHIATNSMKDQLVAATESAARQTGHTAGVADEKARQQDITEGVRVPATKDLVKSSVKEAMQDVTADPATKTAVKAVVKEAIQDVIAPPKENTP